MVIDEHNSDDRQIPLAVPDKSLGNTVVTYPYRGVQVQILKVLVPVIPGVYIFGLTPSSDAVLMQMVYIHGHPSPQDWQVLKVDGEVNTKAKPFSDTVAGSVSSSFSGM
ncbi:UNVERIFIED_CONTAM: hypothetical protein K2H54_066649 [Gekko kuhli]